MSQPVGNYASDSSVGASIGDSLGDSVLILLALTVVQRAVGFVRSLLFCRWLDAEQLGQWDLAFGFLMLAAPLAVVSLSSSFRRYVEQYRQQGQLRAMIARTGWLTAVLAAGAVLAMGLARRPLALLVFGRAENEGMILLSAATLLGLIAFNFFFDLVTAMRNIRFAALLQLVNSAAFAVAGILLVCLWEATAVSVVSSYGAACALSTAVAAVWLLRRWSGLPQTREKPTYGRLCAKLVPFAAAIWITSLLANLFIMADRYMLIHFAGFSSAAALEQVGQYHTARILPLLLVGVAELLGTMIIPHLAHDWEAGNRDRVAARLNLFAKMSAAGLTLAGAAVLLVAPFLFSVVFQRRFDAGALVLPWTLTYCVYFSMFAILQAYCLSCEKAYLGTLSLGIGLAANVVLNLVLLPRYGLLGAVLATTAANALALCLMILLNHRLGFRMHRATWLVLMLPMCFCLGPIVVLGMLAVLVVQAVCSNRLVTADEKRQLAAAWAEYRRRLASHWAGSAICREPRPGEAAGGGPKRAVGPKRNPQGRPHPASPRSGRGRCFSDSEARCGQHGNRLRVMFVITSMPVGGAEVLTAELLRRMDRRRFAPELCCLKHLDRLGEQLAAEVPTTSNLLRNKFDLRVLWRLARIMWRRRVDAVITVGAGDKMFWGRLAAWAARVPVICSALHSTGYPDAIQPLNRLLTPVTDAFIAVAERHRRYLVRCEALPESRVWMIPNGVDLEKFRIRPPSGELRQQLAVPAGAPLAGIVAALRPEKNHALALEAVARVRAEGVPVHLLVVGDGPERAAIEQLARQLGIDRCVHLLGTRNDVPQLLSLVDTVLLTSHMEANPISLLEAMACGKPVLATAVGSVPETVLDGVTGYLVSPGDVSAIARRLGQLLRHPAHAAAMGRAARQHVAAHWSLENTVRGYEQMVQILYCRKLPSRSARGRSFQKAGWLPAE